MNKTNGPTWLLHTPNSSGALMTWRFEFRCWLKTDRGFSDSMICVQYVEVRYDYSAIHQTSLKCTRMMMMMTMTMTVVMMMMTTTTAATTTTMMMLTTDCLGPAQHLRFTPKQNANMMKMAYFLWSFPHQFWFAATMRWQLASATIVVTS